eukprot:3236810-Pyramimonas_sp.AAC.2
MSDRRSMRRYRAFSCPMRTGDTHRSQSPPSCDGGSPRDGEAFGSMTRHAGRKPHLQQLPNAEDSGPRSGARVLRPVLAHQRPPHLRVVIVPSYDPAAVFLEHTLLRLVVSPQLLRHHVAVQGETQICPLLLLSRRRGCMSRLWRYGGRSHVPQTRPRRRPAIVELHRGCPQRLGRAGWGP